MSIFVGKYSCEKELSWIVKNKIKDKDFDMLSKYLDDFQKESFSPINEFEDREKIIDSFIQILKKIDSYA